MIKDDSMADLEEQGSAPATERLSHSYLLGELAIFPPLEEFERQYQKKVRSFEGTGDSTTAAAYERAYNLGAAQLRQMLTEEGRC
ncbi:MAG: hypothetical protein ACKVX7_12360 [Planctomycetota bacterium]